MNKIILFIEIHLYLRVNAGQRRYIHLQAGLEVKIYIRLH